MFEGAPRLLGRWPQPGTVRSRNHGSPARPDIGCIMTQHHEPQGAGERRRVRTDHRSSMSGLDNASVMGAELVVAIVVWTGIGWLLDRWLDTDPVLMIVGALIGNFAGLYLIWLRSGRMDDSERRAAAQRARPRVVTSPVTAVMDAVVAGRTGIPTYAHTHDIGVEPGSDAPADDDDDDEARGGRLLEH